MICVVNLLLQYMHVIILVKQLVLNPKIIHPTFLLFQLCRFLEWMPDGAPFATACFGVRLFEGLGSSAIMVSAYSLVALEYPGEISSVNVSL